jgi:nitrogen fixation/metabolism regulation signal transduction histidine kinase
MMRLRTKFLLFVFILHLVALVLSYFIFRDNIILFIASEFLILVSIVIAWQLYKEMIRPLQSLMSGVEAIKDKDFNVKFLSTGQYEMDRLINIYNQMMDHLREERTRQEQQHFFLEKLIHTSPTGILILDYDENVHQVNPKACELLGINERRVVRKSIEEIDVPMMQEIKQLKSGEGKTISLNGVHTFKLQRSHFIDRGFPRSFVMIEELTAEILAAEKKAYGKVIRMMAHEVNNTIGPVNSILESTLKTTNIWQEGNDSLKEALQVALERNHNLNIFMRNFADVVRLPEPKKKKVDLHKLIQKVTTLMALTAGEKQIEFLFHLDEQSIIITADEQQLEQALINIVKNAMEAINEKGSVAFTTTGSPASLRITDSGTGIAKEHYEHIFSPFFSTKRDGQGVGLTLVKEILFNHGFEFSLNTIHYGNTVFKIGFSYA